VPLSVDDAVLCLAVPQPGNVRAITAKGHDERLRQVVIDVVGLDLRVSVVHDPGATAVAGGHVGSSGSPAPAVRAVGEVASETGGGRRDGGGAGAAAVRSARRTRVPEAADEASPDDPDLPSGGPDGLTLITRELGARPIGEIDHS
jgi:hypothetical protein